MTWAMPDSISPSRMALFQQCPLRFRLETIQKLQSKTGGAAVAGTAIHSALELLFEREPVDRTVEALTDIVETVLVAVKETAEYLSLDDDQLKGFDAKVRRVAPRAFDVVDVGGTEVVGLEENLEVELDGWILRGIIDLLDRTDGGLRIRDWKSGRAPSERFQAKAMQGIQVYSVMAELEYDEVPAEADLLYLDGRIVIGFEPTARSVRAMKGKILATRDAIGRCCDRDDFRPTPSKLCGWCPVEEWCPAHGGDLDAIPVEMFRRA